MDGQSFLHRSWAVLRVAMARLRFLAVFLVAALVVGYWDDIKNHVDKWTRPPVAPDALARAVSGDIEFYCPMHPDVVRSESGQCPKCGMPLVKRKRGEAVQLPADVLARVQLTPQRMALANVHTTPVEYKPLERAVRAFGVLDYDETKVARLSARVAGRADELFVTFTGQEVKPGDPLYSIYSPDVYTAQREYLLARKRVNDLPPNTPAEAKADATAVYNASLEKLVLWGVTKEQLDALDDEFDHTGKVPDRLTVSAPIGGIVARKDINPGQYVQVGESPYTVVDLRDLWLQLKLYERDVPLVQIGDAVELSVEAFPADTFRGIVTFKSFQLDPQTRTLDARVEVNNTGLRLRPGMFASATVRVPLTPSSLRAGGNRDRNPAAQGQPATQPDAAPPSAASQPAARPGPVDPAQAFRAALEAYLQAHETLTRDKAEGVADQLEKTAQALAPLRNDAVVAPSIDPLAKAAATAKGRPLDALRQTFKEASAAMIEIGRAVGTPSDAAPVKVFRCPMKKANWLQRGSDTANPYYGSEMFNCGSAIETLPKAQKKPAASAAPSAPPPASAAERVLAVPRSAVIDTGTNKIVYAESSPGVFDMRAVKLGPAAGDFYPVLEGLEEGDRVVTVGTFLIDAENRLNPMRVAGGAGPSDAPNPAGSHSGHSH
jgi:multidrug efflux pump subunit AcrA (membrane-fusion protein)